MTTPETPIIVSVGYPNRSVQQWAKFSKLVLGLEYYYGIQYKDDFEELFGKYYIGPQELPPD